MDDPVPILLQRRLAATDAPLMAVAWRPASGRGDASGLLDDLLAPLGWPGGLQHTALGQPTHPWLEANGLSVSLSRTRGMAACAVGYGGAFKRQAAGLCGSDEFHDRFRNWGVVGVDVEAIDPDIDAPAVSAMQFEPATAAECTADAAGVARFYEHWTAKEAALKALGTGFARPAPNLVPPPFSPDIAPDVLGVTSDGLLVTRLRFDCGPGFTLTAVILLPRGVGAPVVAGPA